MRLWAKIKSQLSLLFKEAVVNSRTFWNLSPDVVITTHHTKKFAASYCKKGFRNVENSLPLRLGNKDMRVLNSNYIRRVPKLRLAVTLPLGTLHANE